MGRSDTPFAARLRAFVRDEVARWRVPEADRDAVCDDALREAAQMLPPDAPDRVAFDALRALLRVALVDRLQRRHGERAWRFLRRLGCPAEECEDVVSEALLHFARRLDAFDPSQGCYETWLLGFVRNVWRNHRRRMRVWRRGHALTESGTVEHAPSAATAIDRDVEDRELLAWLLAQLSPQQREAWVLQELEGLTQREIAATLQVPPGTVARRVQRAQEKLRELADATTRERGAVPIFVAGSMTGGDLLRELTRVERGRGPEVPDGAWERVRERVRERVLRDVTTRHSSGPPPPTETRAPRRAGTSWMERAAMLGAGAASMVVLQRMHERPPREVVRTVERRVEVPVAAPERTGAPAVAAATAVTVSPARDAGRLRAEPRRVTHDDRELLLIEQAQAAIVRGRMDDARRALDLHAQEFPSGMFAEDRDALRQRLTRAVSP